MWRRWPVFYYSSYYTMITRKLYDKKTTIWSKGIYILIHKRPIISVCKTKEIPDFSFKEATFFTLLYWLVFFSNIAVSLSLFYYIIWPIKLWNRKTTVRLQLLFQIDQLTQKSCVVLSDITFFFLYHTFMATPWNIFQII